MGRIYELKQPAWSTIHTIYDSIQKIAKEIRKDYRRKNRQFVSVISKEFLTPIINPLSRLIRFRSSDELRADLIAKSVRKIHLMALEIERFYETKYVSQLRELAQSLVNLIPRDAGIQLEIFAVEEYIKNVVARPVFKCFKDWLNKFNWQEYRLWKEQYQINLHSVVVYQPLLRGFFVPC